MLKITKNQSLISTHTFLKALPVMLFFSSSKQAKQPNTHMIVIGSIIIITIIIARESFKNHKK